MEASCVGGKRKFPDSGWGDWNEGPLPIGEVRARPPVGVEEILLEDMVQVKWNENEHMELLTPRKDHRFHSRYCTYMHDVDFSAVRTWQYICFEYTIVLYVTRL